MVSLVIPNVLRAAPMCLLPDTLYTTSACSECVTRFSRFCTHSPCLSSERLRHLWRADGTGGGQEDAGVKKTLYTSLMWIIGSGRGIHIVSVRVCVQVGRQCDCNGQVARQWHT